MSGIYSNSQMFMTLSLFDGFWMQNIHKKKNKNKGFINFYDTHVCPSCGLETIKTKSSKEDSLSSTGSEMFFFSDSAISKVKIKKQKYNSTTFISSFRLNCSFWFLEKNMRNFVAKWRVYESIMNDNFDNLTSASFPLFLNKWVRPLLFNSVAISQIFNRQSFRKRESQCPGQELNLCHATSLKRFPIGQYDNVAFMVHVYNKCFDVRWLCLQLKYILQIILQCFNLLWISAILLLYCNLTASIEPIEWLLTVIQSFGTLSFGFSSPRGI